VSGTPLSQLERFGLSSEWAIWRLQRGGLDDWCERCRGRGFVLRRPCIYVDAKSLTPCDSERGCKKCRHRCPACKGSRLRPAEIIRSEDFGDAEALALARRLDPTIEPDPALRIDRDPRALPDIDQRRDGGS